MSYNLRLLIYLRADLGSSVNKFKVSSFSSSFFFFVILNDLIVSNNLNISHGSLSTAVDYLSAGLVVVQVHESPTGGLAFTPLPHIDKGLREGHSICNVIAAA